MGAAAAAARKPAHSQNGADPTPQWIRDDGYLTWPRACRRLKRCLIPTQVFVLEELLWETANAPGRPEWAKLTEEWFADQIGCTVQQASECLKALEFRAKLIESRKAGRGKEYRVLGERLSLIEERERRAIEKKAEPKAAGRGKFIVTSSQPMEYVPEQPVSKILIETEDGQTISYDATESQSILRLVAKADLETITPVMVSSPSKSHRPKVETITPVMVSPLRELVTDYFLKMDEPPPDDKLLDDIRQELGDATLDEYRGVIQRRFHKGDARRIRRGLFKNMAADARQLHMAVARRQPKPPPPPMTEELIERAPDPDIGEPEDSRSPWAKIRREMKTSLDTVEYAYLRNTRFHSLDTKSYRLIVEAATAERAAHLRDYFTKRILKCSRFNSVEFIFKVAEENS